MTAQRQREQTFEALARSPLDVRWRSARRYEPRMSADQRDSLYHDWLRAVERSKAWAGDTIPRSLGVDE